jgi:hypothetical protein
MDFRDSQQRDRIDRHRRTTAAFEIPNLVLHSSMWQWGQAMLPSKLSGCQIRGSSHGTI